MKWLEKFFFKNELQQFNLQPVQRMQTGVIVVLVIFIVMYGMQFLLDDNGYAIEERIYNGKISKTCIADSVFYTAKGILPIPANNYIDKVLFTMGKQYSASGFNVSTVDFIAVILLLWFMNRFIRNFIHYGPFALQATKYIRWSVVVCIMMHLLSAVMMFILNDRFEAQYGNKYRLDTSVYFGQGWIYIMCVYAFILNIFNYGRKLQEEVDLTV